VQHIVVRLDPQYAQAYADCGTAQMAAQLAASTDPAAKFLASVPCDANGNPLTEKR